MFIYINNFIYFKSTERVGGSNSEEPQDGGNSKKGKKFTYIVLNEHL